MNRVTLAVAGSRKTQSIVDSCARGEPEVKRLVLTYTQTGQAEVDGRLRQACGLGAAPDVMGWFAFLMRHCIQPYLPRKYPGRRLRGLNFEGDPGRFARNEDRYFDAQDRAYRLHLSRLAYDVSTDSNGAVVDRLSHIYNEIYIDEVQDLTGCDLYILQQLMECPSIDVYMVGDVRQSLFDTNPRDQNFKQYRGVKMLDWFEVCRNKNLLEIEHIAKTWRSNQAIADFSDRIFPAEFAVEWTVSMQTEKTDHDGVFAIAADDVPSYLRQHDAQPLRDSKSTARNVDLPFRNFGMVKGLTFDRVLIYPTKTVTAFLTDGTSLASRTACGLYVAVTRAKYSVAFVVPDPYATTLTAWISTSK